MARVQLHSLYSPAPHHVDPLTSTPDSTLQGGAREEAGEGGPGRGGRGAGGEEADADVPALPRLAVALTPAAHPALGRKAVVRVGAYGSRGFGEPRQPWLFLNPPPITPPRAQRPWSVPLAHVAKDGHLR
jgi:hypothetical protein